MTKPPTDPAATRTLALAGELRVLVGQLKRRLREEVRAGDLTASQLSVLGRLERDGPATVTRLAQAEGVRPQSMGATIASLEKIGFVRGSAHPTDGRQTLFSVTPVCHAWIKVSRAAREDWLAHAIQAHLAPAEQKQLASAVTLLKRLVDK
jgi:DNA-binding MarR family transcriptional regulator